MHGFVPAAQTSTIPNSGVDALRMTLRPFLVGMLALSLLAGAAGCGSSQSASSQKGGSSQSSSGKSSGGSQKSSGGKSGKSSASSQKSSGSKSGGASGKSGEQSAAGQGKKDQGQKSGAAGGLMAAGTPTTYHFYLSVLTGGMVGKPGWPLFTPADFTLPPSSPVVVTIRNFDSGAAPVTAAYSRVSGTTGGDMQVAGKTVRSIPPQTVSHTFTVPQLHLNVPIPASSTVSFTFHTPASGTYTWRCEAPCGTGSNGMQGSMRSNGYMTGTMRISAS